MENMINNLDEILKSVIDIRMKYQLLKQRNKDIEVQLSDLKVEADHYKNEIINLKKELDEKEKSVKYSMPVNTDESSKTEVESIRQHQETVNAKMKLQIDEFIEDIDQCIQIIQSKE